MITKADYSTDRLQTQIDELRASWTKTQEAFKSYESNKSISHQYIYFLNTSVGLSTGKIGSILGITRQRVGQILASIKKDTKGGDRT